MHRVCIVTDELNGFFKNGGVGTACTGLARYLARTGRDVTVLYTAPPPRNADEAGATRALQEAYKRDHGITVAMVDLAPYITHPIMTASGSPMRSRNSWSAPTST